MCKKERTHHVLKCTKREEVAKKLVFTRVFVRLRILKEREKACAFEFARVAQVQVTLVLSRPRKSEETTWFGESKPVPDSVTLR